MLVINPTRRRKYHPLMIPFYQSTYEIRDKKTWTMTNGLHPGLLLAKQIGAGMVTRAFLGKFPKMIMTRT
jgi:hypothetical protein